MTPFTGNLAQMGILQGALEVNRTLSDARTLSAYASSCDKYFGRGRLQ